MVNLGYMFDAACVYGQNKHLNCRKQWCVVRANHAPFLFAGKSLSIGNSYAVFLKRGRRQRDLFIMLIGAVFGYNCQNCSSDVLDDIRQMDGVPNVSANQIIQGN